VIAGKTAAASSLDLQRRENRMKHYLGDRTIDGVTVTVDGVPLDPRLQVKEFTKNGFEWSYEGPEPRQLALALLADHLGDDAAAMASVESFMRSVVANFGNEWELTSADIDQALAALSGKTAA
jgi:hypothetical protein